MPLKVLYITHYDTLYGANKSLLQLIIDLKKNNAIIAYVIIPNEGAFSKELNNNDIKYFVFRYYNWLTVNGFLKNQIKRFINKFLFLRIYKILNGIGIEFDLIHTNSSVTNLGGYLSKKLNTPHIWHIREYGKEDFNLNYFYNLNKAGRYFDSASTKVITVSKDLKDYYSQYIPSQKIEVIYNGILVKANKKTYNYNEPLRIAIVGVISENKNQIELIKALAYLKSTVLCTNFVLYLVGDGNEEYIELLRAYIKEQSLTDNIVFKGYVTNVENLLSIIDLGVVCSKREAFGRVTVEFMMNKIPVIASNTGANKELISSEYLGVLYEYGNFKDLAIKIQSFINNRKLLKEIGENSFLHVEKNFSSSLNSSRIYHEYKKAIDS